MFLNKKPCIINIFFKNFFTRTVFQYNNLCVENPGTTELKLAQNWTSFMMSFQREYIKVI